MKPNSIISSALPFPPISWWKAVANCPTVYFDGYEHFQKMSLRNRFYLAGPTGKHLLSIPLTKGRGQRTLLKDVQMDHSAHWAIKHWRTIQSFYGRSPFFEFYADDIYQLLLDAEHTDSLFEWNLEGIKRISKWFSLSFEIQETTTFQKDYPPEIPDLRFQFTPAPLPEYHQVFLQKTGFIPDCSILDLLFCEGNNAFYTLMAGEEY